MHFRGRDRMAYARHVLKVLGYFNPLYDPLDKHLRPSDPAREFYGEKCLKRAPAEALPFACPQISSVICKVSSFSS